MIQTLVYFASIFFRRFTANVAIIFLAFAIFGCSHSSSPPVTSSTATYAGSYQGMVSDQGSMFSDSSGYRIWVIDTVVYSSYGAIGSVSSNGEATFTDPGTGHLFGGGLKFVGNIGSSLASGTFSETALDIFNRPESESGTWSLTRQ